jgi:spermidine/putrescine transport system substrate-binding protein
MTRFATMTAAAALLAGAAQAEGEVRLYHWFEYIPQELLDKFEAETGIEVIMDTYDSNEALLASLKAGASAATTSRCPATTWSRS